MREIYFNIKSEKYGFLSNLYPASIILVSPITNDGIPRRYASVEHFYQSSKFTEPDIVSRVLSASTPLLAMKIAHSIPKDMIRLDLDKVMDSVMLAGVKAKFGQSEALRQQLVSTGDAVLHEDTSHPYWGCRGKDKLGKILMIIRETSRNQEK